MWKPWESKSFIEMKGLMAGILYRHIWQGNKNPWGLFTTDRTLKCDLATKEIPGL